MIKCIMILSENMVSQHIWIGIFIGLFFVGIVSFQPNVFGEHVIVEGEKRAMEGILKTERETMVSEMQEKSKNLEGGDSSMGFFNSYDFELQSAVIIAIIISAGSAIGLIYYWKKRK